MLSQVRLIVLNLMCLSVLFTIGKVVFDPTAGRRPFADFELPNAVPLAGWELVDSQPLVDSAATTVQYNQIKTGQRYVYRQAAAFLSAEIRYVVNTNGDVLELLEQTSGSSISDTKQTHTTSGFYSSYTTPGQLHLTSCINPRGNNTSTSTQFFQNRYTYDLQPEHLLGWALGRENLIDQRCLWLHLSMVLQSSDPNSTLVRLEEVWQRLTIWGQSQFPKP